MKKTITYLLFSLFVSVTILTSCVKDRDFSSQNTTIDLGTRKLIHYWNFNDTSSLTNLIQPTFSVDPTNAKLDFDFLSISGVDGYYDFRNPGSSINVRNGDAAGALLRVRNPSADMIISMPTRHYKNVVLQYAVAISSTTSGALNDSVYYSLDGINYTNQGLSNPNYAPAVDPSFTLISYDLSGITAANDNPNLKFKIVFNNGNTNTTGNTRFDNITVDADTLIGGTPPVDNFPVAVNDNFTTSMDSTITGNVATNDIPSADGGNKWSIVNNPSNGTITLDSTGNFSFTPSNHFIGSDSFSYKIVDADGDADTAVAYMSINALPIVLMHYWDFNNIAGGLPSMIIPAVTNDPVNTKLDFLFNTSGTTTGYYDTVASTTNLNITNNSIPGYSLRVRNPSNELTISAPTTNFKNVSLKYAVAISSAKYAPRTQSYSYSTDNGTTWSTTGLSTIIDTFAIDANDTTRFVDPNYVLKTFDFSNIPAVNNNSGFKFKIIFGASNTPASPTKGNTRFDNITVEGNRQ